ncbi:hypothetical protein GOP47_0000734 [Adiantum capillus-veneris]|uniref:Pectinesterase n=1 Tax=Adiantum capillus-veneris TaxID=13818 RepID=A0A9D4ZTC5_ADICA|nr:hypothetical protein GOP47_0000734 [Adiantum capillus-veneris]
MYEPQFLVLLCCCIGTATLIPSGARGDVNHVEVKLDKYHSNSTWVSSLLHRDRKLLPSYTQSAIISKYITVDQHGQGQYATIQAAVDSIPDKNTKWVYIQINAGIYIEKVTIPYTKPYIIFQGAGRTSTVISWNDRASSYGTADSATFSANAASFVARGIGFKNAAPTPPPGARGGQAVAVLLGGDMMAFYECGFYGAQDTLFDYQGRHYFKGCYIEGSIDFIFGHGQSTYKECELFVKAEPGYLSGSITAQNREDPHDAGGFVFVDCKIDGTGEVFLGRAWGAYSRVIFMYTYMSSIVAPEGWFDWDNPSRRSTAYYGEYKCYGPGADTSGRVSWSHKLNDEQAQPFLELSYIDGGSWLQES